MVANIVVWKSKKESPKAFLDSLNEEQQELTVLLSPEESGLFPTDETNYEQWMNAFVDLEQKYAKLIAARGEAISTIVHIILDSDSDEETHTVVSLICELCTQRKYMKHLVWLCDKYSVHVKQERSFVKCIHKDVDGYLDFKKEFAREKSRLEDKSEEKRNQILADRQTALNSHNQIFQIATETKNSIREKEQELESKYLKTRWDRLSILFDTDSNGGQSDEILKLRSAAAVGAIFAAETIRDEFEIRCYGIQKTPYSQEEFELLPAYCLYKKICEHKEEITDILNEITPNFSFDIGAFACADEEVLAHALIADDNNYDERSARELLRSFMDNNPAYELKGPALQYIQESVARWLEHAKTVLAQWVDLDSSVEDYFAPASAPEPAGTFERDMQREIKACKIEAIYEGVGNFGKTVPLATRLESARKLANKLLDYLKTLLRNDLYENVLLSMDKLRSYLRTIREINLQVFDPYGKMQGIMVYNFAWQQKLTNKAIWFGSAGKPADGTPEEYIKWLKRTLQSKTEEMLRGINQNGYEGEYETFSAERLIAAPETKLISEIVCYPAGDNDVFFTYDGYRCKLICYKTDEAALNPEMIFVRAAEANQQGKNEECGLKQEITACEGQDESERNYIDLTISHNADYSFTITIPWPNNVTELRLDVRDANGETRSLRKNIVNENRGARHTLELSFADIHPGEKTFLLTITGGANIGQVIAEKKENIAVPEFPNLKSRTRELTFMEKIKTLFAKKIGYEESLLDFRKPKNVPLKNLRIRLIRNGNRFDYRIKSGTNELTMIHPEHNSKSIIYKMIYKDE